jgi:cytochrome c6
MTTVRKAFMQKTMMALAVLLGALVFVSSAAAQGSAAKIYQGKCMGCHAADGSGSSIGKKLGARDFHSADVQKQSDAELSGVIENGKGKMPPYGKSLKPDEIKGLVAYVRELGKK